MGEKTGTDCDRVRNQLIPYLKGEIDEGTRAGIERHLADCDACRGELEVACRLLAITDAASGPATDRAVQTMLDHAIRMGASDIHLEPQSEGLRIRLRRDGLLESYTTLLAPLHQAFVHRLKLRAGLDLTETRRPQQGRFRYEAEGKRFDIRVGTLAEHRGERLTLRILSRSDQGPPLEEVCPSPEDRKRLRRWVHQPNGLILVSGPANGSGKVMTAYVLLQEAADPGANAMAVGSWAPYELRDVSRVEIMGPGPLSAAEALQAILAHQDPDILLVEEIRGPELALEAVETALTGHLVIAGIRGKAGAFAARQMLEYGVDAEALAEALNGITSQRLARRICSGCKSPAEADPALLDKLGLPADTVIYRGSGCSICGGRGWKGRAVLLALYDFTDGRMARFPADGSRDELLRLVQEGEVRTLRESAAEAVRDGLTTAEEALRVIG